MEHFSLTHIIQKPRVATKSGRVPLLLLLHGFRSDEHDLISLSEELDPRFFIVSARAPLSIKGGGYAWFPITFSEKGIIVDSIELAEQSRKLVVNLIDELINHYQLDQNQVYLMGFSQGSVMSYSVALTEPKKISAVVATSGRIPPEEHLPKSSIQDLLGLKFFVSHGLYDEVLPIQNGRESKSRLEQLRANFIYKEYPMAHQITSESLSDISRWLTNELNQN